MTSDIFYDDRGKKGKSSLAKIDICLFHDLDDGQEWCAYWKKMMSCSEVKLTIEVCDTLISAHEFRAKVNKSKLLVILTTNNMLQFIKDDESHFPTLSKRTQVANILCHTSQDDMNDSSTAPFVSKWKTFVAGDVGIANRSIVGDLLELIEQQEQLQTKQRKTKMRKFKIMPSHVHEREETIAVIFRTEFTGRVEIAIGTDETRYVAQRMNPFACSFRMPDTCHVVGKTKLKVYKNGTFFAEHPLTISLPTLEPYQSPAFLSQILRVPVGNNEALDKELVKVYRKSLPDDDALECILGEFYEDITPNRSKHELPTLLHFAAKNGLSELCSLLLDTPGSLAAFQLENIDGYDPADLADKHGHTELCDYLRTFVDVEATVHACEDIYLEMSGRKLYENQYELGMNSDPSPCSIQQSSHDRFKKSVPKTPVAPAKPSRRYSEPDPSRPPLPAPRKCPTRQPSAEEFMGMTGTQNHAAGKSATLPCKGSAAENDLIGILSAVKEGEFTLNEAERLYESWKKQNANNSRSIRERKEALDTLRNEYMSMFDIVKEQNKGKGVFKKIKNRLVKKKSQQNLNISTPTLLRDSRGSISQNSQERNSNSSSGSRVSGSSQASSYDFCSPGSESDELLDEDESSGEEAAFWRPSATTSVEPVAGSQSDEAPVRMRISTSSTHSREARKTMRNEFLETAKSFDDVAPPLPPRYYVIS
ncbi:phosphoinositide 3-kinase adapter protein 1-like [Ylistrum balloti]|uniref:phosphoinositide 3-kinase adapter protein 1-like n=1 Tax=Ylistrum balloti TaxID=509963 RepID=UPI0029058E81|nr:phosphoinositide 3-kinase adapter protein 1-like [Ylistrum balloti]